MNTVLQMTKTSEKYLNLDSKLDLKHNKTFFKLNLHNCEMKVSLQLHKTELLI